jgi:hypothetical protein
MGNVKHAAMFVLGVYASVAVIRLVNGLLGGKLPLAP